MKLKQRDPAKYNSVVKGLKDGQSIREVAVKHDMSPTTVNMIRFEIPNEDLPTFKKRMSGKYAVALERLTDRLIEQAATAKGVKDISIAIGVTQDKKALYDGDAGQVIRVEHIELPSINDIIDLLPTANVSQVTDAPQQTPANIEPRDGCHNRSTANKSSQHRGEGIATEVSGETTTD
tara:strand:- start:314 stop:847 length:534 start_codon:yes stop_codon:yes gene_type:complete